MTPTCVDNTTSKERKQLNVAISKDAYEAWQTFARQRGVSMTALIEAIGQTLAVVIGQGIELPEMGEGIVAQAREIDAENRRRS